MPPKEDKLLDVLRSLRPPGAAGVPGERSPTPGRPPAGPIVDPSVAAPGAIGPQPGWRVGDQPEAKRRTAKGTIELRLEEAGIFFLAAMVLVVLAFLMGWYGRSISGPAADTEARSSGPVRLQESGVQTMERPAAQDLGSRQGEVRPSAGATSQIYSILVARFPTGGEAEAEDHRKLLEERGYTPAWIRRTTTGVELLLGRFEIPTDALAMEWLPRLRRMHGVYASSQMVKIPRE